MAQLRYPDDGDDNPVKGYTITNADQMGRAPETRHILDTGALRIRRKWTVRGYYQYDDDDATELLFRDDLERLMDELSPFRSLGGGTVVNGLPDLVSFVLLAVEGYLVHYAEIEFETVSEWQVPGAEWRKHPNG